MERNEVRDACWTLASQGPNDESSLPHEAVIELAQANPSEFLEHLVALIGAAATTEDASYLYRGGLAALVEVGDDWARAANAECQSNPRFAHVAFDALEFHNDRALRHRVLDRQLVVRTWVTHQLSGRTNGDDDEFWAWEAVSEACDDSNDEHWSLILDLLDAAPNDDVLSMVGVGPIEDWIGGGWEEGVRRIEEEARSNARLRTALSGIWIDGIPEEFFLRIERAAGVKLTRMK